MSCNVVRRHPPQRGRPPRATEQAHRVRGAAVSFVGTLRREGSVPTPRKARATQNRNRHTEPASFSPTASPKGQEQAQTTTKPKFKEQLSLPRKYRILHWSELKRAQKYSNKNDQAIGFPFLSHPRQNISPWTLSLVIIHLSDHKTEFPIVAATRRE